MTAKFIYNTKLKIVALLISTLFILTSSSTSAQNYTKEVAGIRFHFEPDYNREFGTICNKSDSSLPCSERFKLNPNFLNSKDSFTKKTQRFFKNKCYFLDDNLRFRINETDSALTASIEIDLNNNKYIVQTPINNTKELPIVHTDSAISFKLFGKQDTLYLSSESVSNNDTIKALKLHIAKRIKERSDTISKQLTDWSDQIWKSLAFDLFNQVILLNDKVKLSDSADSKYCSFYLSDKSKTFQIRMCIHGTDQCHFFGPFENTIDKRTFIGRMTHQHKVIKPETANYAVLEKLWAEINGIKYNNRSKAFRVMYNNDLQSVADSIVNEEIKYSGVVKANSLIPLRIHSCSCVLHHKCMQCKKREIRKKEKYKSRSKRSGSKEKEYKSRYRCGKCTTTPALDSINARRFLSVKKIHVSIFNNRIDKLIVYGYIPKENTEYIGGTRGNDSTYVVMNNIWSIPVSDFNNRRERVYFNSQVHKDVRYSFNVGDVLKILPHKGKYNYSLQNQEFDIDLSAPKDSAIKIAQKGVSDFFSGFVYSDVLGLSSTTNNSLFIAEARVFIPFHYRSWGVLTFFDNISFYGRATLLGNADGEGRFTQLKEPYKSWTPDRFDITKEEAPQINSFNLLYNNNFDGGLRFTPLSLEWKGATTFLNIRLGYKFLRTTVNYNLIGLDSVLADTTGNFNTIESNYATNSFQAFSRMLELDLVARYRPQSNFSADIILGVGWLSERGTNINDLELNVVNQGALFIKTMANLYYKVPEKKSGIACRFGGYTNTFNKYRRVYPVLKIGYATNLSAFVNKLQGK